MDGGRLLFDDTGPQDLVAGRFSEAAKPLEEIKRIHCLLSGRFRGARIEQAIDKMVQ